MPALDLTQLPPELQAALEAAWPGCPEAQRRALLAPQGLDGPAIWPDGLWAWQPGQRWWRPWRARQRRRADHGFFTAPVRDARGKAYPARLFDPGQPFFQTPWTHADVLLRSPEPDVFSDADFWAIKQLLYGGDVHWATRTVQAWANGMRADGALHGARRNRWLADAQWRLAMSATGTYT